MSEDKAIALQHARRFLMNDASQAKRIGMSAGAWEDEVQHSEYGQMVGPRQVEAVWRLVWGIGCAALRG